MLENLVIKNFAIIEDIEVSFKDGMNCIVGETIINTYLHSNTP